MRTRPHILEDESKNALRQSIPTKWVFREKSLDYGIDGEIEIFNEKGIPTGQVYWIQLKATDSSASNGVIKLSLPVDKIRQLKSYQIPVMVIRYSSADKLLWGKWVTNIHLTKKSSSQKSVTIQFTDDDLLHTDRYKKVGITLEELSKQNNRSVEFPIEITLSIEPRIQTSISNLEIRAAIRRELSKSGELIQVSNKDESSKFHLTIKEGEIVLSLFHFYEKVIYRKNFEKTRFVQDALSEMIIYGVSSCLFLCGRSNTGSKLLLDSGVLYRLANRKELIIELIPNLVSGDHYSVALKQLDDLIKSDRSDNTIQMATLVCAFLYVKNSRSRKQLMLFLKEQVKNAVTYGGDEILGHSYYNLGNFYRADHKYNESKKFYLEASRVYPKYETKDYFLGEIAGLYHLTGEYEKAYKAYLKAYDLNNDKGLYQALAADSMMYAGEYEDALELFDSYLKGNSQRGLKNSEWQLKYTCLATLLQNDYPKEQKREIKASEKELINEGDVQVRSQLEKALSLDLLNSLAWYNMGWLNFENEDYMGAMFGYLLAAVLNENDPQSWANCTGCIFKLPEDEVSTNILGFVIHQAYEKCGDKYVDQILSGLVEAPDEVKKYLLDIINEVIKDIADDKSSVLRFYLAGDEILEINV